MSFSQFGEDRAVAALFEPGYQGFYVDVGAHNGVLHSNTLLFERRGWRGICIEPHAGFFAALKVNRPNSLCLSVAAWNENAESCDFYATAEGGWSRVGAPGGFKVVGVQHPPLRTLDAILEECEAPAPFDLFSLDVEGTEWYVLGGFTLERYRPRIALVEELFPENRRFRLKPENTVSEVFDEFFEGYIAVRRRVSCNVIFCRERGDAEVIRKIWGEK